MPSVQQKQGDQKLSVHLTIIVQNNPHTYHHPVPLSLNLGTLTSWNSLGHSRPVTELLLTIPTQLLSWRWPSPNTFGMWTVLYWTRFSRTQFDVSINVWSLAGDTLNITCNFLYCIISSTNFNAQFSLFVNNMFVTLLSSTCLEH